MKQTAIEWLIDKHFGGIDNVTPDFKYHIKQAKEMEKEQHDVTFAAGYDYRSSKEKNIIDEHELKEIIRTRKIQYILSKKGLISKPKITFSKKTKKIRKLIRAN